MPPLLLEKVASALCGRVIDLNLHYPHEVEIPQAFFWISIKLVKALT